jgi:hypothetical protein
VPVLARKPGALRNGAPFKDWVLPAAIERIRRKLAGADDVRSSGFDWRISKVSIECCGQNLGVAEQLADHWQALAYQQAAGGEGMP